MATFAEAEAHTHTHTDSAQDVRVVVFVNLFGYDLGHLPCGPSPLPLTLYRNPKHNPDPKP